MTPPPPVIDNVGNGLTWTLQGAGLIIATTLDCEGGTTGCGAGQCLST